MRRGRRGVSRIRKLEDLRWLGSIWETPSVLEPGGRGHWGQFLRNRCRAFHHRTRKRRKHSAHAGCSSSTYRPVYCIQSIQATHGRTFAGWSWLVPSLLCGAPSTRGADRHGGGLSTWLLRVAIALEYSGSSGFSNRACPYHLVKEEAQAVSHRKRPRAPMLNSRQLGHWRCVQGQQQASGCISMVAFFLPVFL